MSRWYLETRHPSGETLVESIGDEALTIGDAHSQISLRDPEVDQDAIQIFKRNENSKESPFWIQCLSEKRVTLGDLPIERAYLPVDTPVKIGSSSITLRKHDESPKLPPIPSGARPWFTTETNGAETLWKVRKVSQTDLSVYLKGETGTGKEVLARLLHTWSARSSSPFVPIHCGALPPNLIESELFGHKKGAFTGAEKDRPGALLNAHNGTVLLDEVGELSLEAQVKLLRFLEDGEIRAVGSDRPIHANVRIVCATHRSLVELVQKGSFRRDLYYRLASITVDIPPLRDRPGDIELIAKKMCERLDKALTPDALLRLQSHAWGGNVRELQHSIERAAGLAGPFQTLLQREDFDFLIDETDTSVEEVTRAFQVPINLKEMERYCLIRALRIAKGNRQTAAEILGIARSTVFEKLKKHNIPGPRMAMQGPAIPQ